MIIKIFLLIVGLVLLALGADWLVKRASRLALSLGISALVVGLTVVSYGAIALEFSVSVILLLETS
jgi:cation:H+ antiporter